MSTFTSPFTALDIEYIDGRDYVLLKEFDYHVGFEGSDEVIHIPAGFHTDFASVPQLFWNIIPPTGKYGLAAVVHDFLYRVGHPQPPANRYTRAQCDAIFREAMGVLGVNWLERWIIWAGVRIGGGHSYKHHTQKSANG